MASKCSSERKLRESLISNQKSATMKPPEEDSSRDAESQVVNAKEKFKDIESATPVNTQMLKKNSLKMIWKIEDQTSHNIPLNQSLIQCKALTLFTSMKAERAEEAAEEKSEASRGWFMRLKERNYLCNIEVQGEAASADVEAAASSPADIAKVTDEGGHTQQIFNTDKIAFYWKKMHKSMPGFKASKNRLTLLLGANIAGDYKLKPMLIHHSKNPTALKNCAKSTLPVLYERNNTAWMTAHLFTVWFPVCFKPILETYCKKKREIPFKILLLVDNALGHPGALTEIHREILFLSANTISILRPMDQGLTLTFKSYYRNTFHKHTAARDGNSSDGSGQSKWKTFWKEVAILDAIQNIRDLREEVKIATSSRVGKKLISTLMDDSEVFKTSVEKITADVVEIPRELELEVEPKDVTEFLQSQTKLMDGSWLPVNEQRRQPPEIKSTPGEDIVNIIEMATKDLQYSINLVDKAMAGIRIGCKFERTSIVGKMLSNSITYYREICHEMLLSYFNNCHSHPKLQHHHPPSTSRQDLPPTKRLRLSRQHY
uniref:HTH CENPB-type domain-containing protein n=1 Tax=Chlorocebus sabaeus TaxID=60711 RepID=A0A0D9S877_CHLSB